MFDKSIVSIYVDSDFPPHSLFLLFTFLHVFNWSTSTTEVFWSTLDVDRRRCRRCRRPFGLTFSSRPTFCPNGPSPCSKRFPNILLFLDHLILHLKLHFWALQCGILQSLMIGSALAIIYTLCCRLWQGISYRCVFRICVSRSLSDWYCNPEQGFEPGTI